MATFFQAALKIVESVPFSWFMILQSIATLIQTQSTINIVLSVIGLLLFSPCVYKYHIKKSIDVYGNPLS